MVGYEAAQKIAVTKMVQRQLGLSEIPDPDADGDLAQVFGTRRDGGLRLPSAFVVVGVGVYLLGAKQVLFPTAP
jgi:hypothetical protein